MIRAQFINEVASASIDRAEVLIAGMAAMLITIFLGPEVHRVPAGEGVRPADP